MTAATNRRTSPSEIDIFRLVILYNTLDRTISEIAKAMIGEEARLHNSLEGGITNLPKLVEEMHTVFFQLADVNQAFPKEPQITLQFGPEGLERLHRKVQRTAEDTLGFLKEMKQTMEGFGKIIEERHDRLDPSHPLEKPRKIKRDPCPSCALI